MWRPGFNYLTSNKGVLNGWHRDMCVQSIHYRGTTALPGLVCGLKMGGSCAGQVFGILRKDVQSVVSYLDERELITNVYRVEHLPITLQDGSEVVARVYVADECHEQFAGDWPDEKKIRYIKNGIGTEGSSLDYLAYIVQELAQLGLVDDNLRGLLDFAKD
jgi:cation transport protein ChaC